ncbi:MAG: flagellar protein FliS [Fibrobacterota bacterium]
MKQTRKEIAEYYRRITIETASSWKQIVLLHEKLAKLIAEALRGAEKGHILRLKLNQGQNIISQLQIALKEETDDAAQSLFLLYDYIYTKLESSKPEDWQAALEIVEPLRETFEELLKRK